MKTDIFKTLKDQDSIEVYGFSIYTETFYFPKGGDITDNICKVLKLSDRMFDRLLKEDVSASLTTIDIIKRYGDSYDGAYYNVVTNGACDIRNVYERCINEISNRIVKVSGNVILSGSFECTRRTTNGGKKYAEITFRYYLGNYEVVIKTTKVDTTLFEKKV